MPEALALAMATRMARVEVTMPRAESPSTNAQAGPSGGYDLLMVAQLSSIAQGEIYLERPDGPALTLKDLPYSLPASSPADAG